MRLRIGINARLLTAPTLRGWNRYAVNLLASLTDRDMDLILYSDSEIHPDHLARLDGDHVTIRISPTMRYTQWEQFWLPRQCVRDGVDILHSPLNFGLPWMCRCPRVLTLHDAIDQLYYGPKKSLRDQWSPRQVINRLRHWSSRQYADAIITVSEHAKTDLIHGLGLPPSKIRVIAEAADPSFLEPIPDHERLKLRQTFDLKLPYIFYVGGWEQRKNIPFLLRAFARAQLHDTELVMAGGRDDQRSHLMSLAEELGIGGQLRLLGWVQESDLRALYAEALGFCYPSEYEGFGLQLCEAMAVGCPVLAARATCLPEVLGSGGEMFTLDEPGELAGLLRRLASDSLYRQELSEKAQRRSVDFSWARAADQTVEVYRSLISEAACELADRP